MAKERSSEDKNRKEHKKHRRSTEDGVKKHKHSKDKHEKKHRTKSGAEEAPTDPIPTSVKSTPAVHAKEIEEEEDDDDDDDDDKTLANTATTAPVALPEATKGENATRTTVPPASLVPFANPLANDKSTRKVLKGVRRATKRKTIRRGVKEVVKFLRKSASNPSTKSSSPLPQSVVVLAADISPMDVISHLPVLCEDHGVPYVYVTSRAELGLAGGTKRPTSVVMLVRDIPVRRSKQAEAGTGEKEGKKEKKEEAKEEGSWEEEYGEVVKVVEKLGRSVRI